MLKSKQDPPPLISGSCTMTEWNETIARKLNESIGLAVVGFQRNKINYIYSDDSHGKETSSEEINKERNCQRY